MIFVMLMSARVCIIQPTEYDEHYDDEDGFYEFAEAIQNYRAESFQVIEICAGLMVC